MKAGKGHVFFTFEFYSHCVFKTSKENYPDNESVTAIMLLLIQFWESSTLPDSGKQIKLKKKKVQEDCSNAKQAQCRVKAF